MPRKGAGGAGYSGTGSSGASPNPTTEASPATQPAVGEQQTPQTDTVVLRSVPLIPSPRPRGHGFSVPLAELAPCPRNLRGGDLYGSPADREKLVTQLRETGQIQALVVIDIGVYLDAYPGERHHFNDEHKYVIVAGHCRRDCAPDAGLTELRVEIQNHYVDKLTEVFLGENLGRNDLTVFQEAEGYRRLRDDKEYSYQRIAEIVGVSKSNVVKRMAILPLADVPEARTALLSGDLGLEAAYVLLAELGDPALVLSTFNRAKYSGQALNAATLKALAQEVLIERARAQEGRVEEEPDASSLAADSGSSRTDAAVPPSGSENDAGSSRTDGSESTPTPDGSDAEAANPTTGSSQTGQAPTGTAPGLPSPRTTTKPGQALGSRSVDPDRARRALAARARGEACQRLLSAFDDETPSLAALRTARTLLTLASRPTVELAHRWVQKIGVYEAETMDAAVYRDHLLTAGDPAAVTRFAYAVSLADDEVRSTDSRRSPDTRVINYWRHLTDDAGYEPSWERDHLQV
ncbi:hypothetical protein [Kitasatospora sp. NPDC086791]|uniref:ParB/RepB/Spo0J family partition protein n=1 Tax=Kitasatospora sp. NPDC086791 TaxID=3155178 RepID=UPI00344A75A3